MNPMRVLISSAIGTSFLIVAMAATAAAQHKQTLTGTITDSMCISADHSRMHMGPSDAACTLACVNVHGATFELYDGKNTTYALSDQKAAEKFAGQKVKVVGTLDASARMIQVDSITDNNLNSLTAAYMAVVAIFFAYGFTVARRVARLQIEIARLKS